MSEHVVVKQVGEGRPWEHGITYWDVCFERNGEDFHCTWGKKETPPTVGEQAEGEFFQKNGEWRFRKASKPPAEVQTGSAASQNAGGKREWKPESQYDPEKTARIGRSHAQHMAILTCEGMGLFESVSADQIASKIKSWTTFYMDDVNAAGEAAKQASGIAAPQGKEGAAPLPASASPASASRPADDTHQFLCTIIETAGLAAYPASKLADFIVSKLNPGQRKRAETGLSDLDTAGETLAKLKTAYEQAEGPLPEADIEDSIPF
jgi:hypothetical protein